MTERPAHTGLRHLALNVRHMAAMRRFYTELLGFDVEWEPDPDNVYLSSGLDNLALHSAAPVANVEGLPRPAPGEIDGSEVEGSAGEGALDHLGLIVREMDDVDRWAAFLEERGVMIDARPRTHRDGARSCYFRDPDGNKVQIIYHPPISQKI